MKAEFSPQDKAYRAKSASTEVGRYSAERRKDALLAVADALQQNEQVIIDANAKDLSAAEAALNSGEMTSSMYGRLKLDRDKLTSLIAGIRQVAELPDLVGAMSMARELDEGLVLYKQSCPIGVVLIIFESRPDALPQIVSLLIKSGNAALIKSGKEARHSVQALFKIIMDTLIDRDYPPEVFGLLESREEVNSLMKMEGVIDLVIPRGSNQLVRQIQESTRIPVLGHADGVCHIYVDEHADFEKALRICTDAKCQYPSACNAVETILVHRKIAPQFLPRLVKVLQEKKVEVRCDADTIAELNLTGAKPTTQLDWSTEYCDLIVSIRVVEQLNEATGHINTYSSRHTDAIITEDKEAFEKFAGEVDSAGVYWNASTRFADGFRYGFGAEVGISTSKLHPRGPVGIDGLLTYKYRLIGNGHIVGDYTGPSSKSFTHRDMDIKPFH
ncbi:MAG: glutamate-5-semialdehyde dehydrogenase [Candidatus Obscuribacterales bacterium]|nr:glutamate-5-semialdehyde dehydrogenase [Candidatus Obscuribacterales bacterium]